MKFINELIGRYESDYKTDRVANQLSVVLGRDVQKGQTRVAHNFADINRMDTDSDESYFSYEERKAREDAFFKMERKKASEVQYE